MVLGKKFFQQKARETSWVVPNDAMLFEQIVEHNAVPKLLQVGDVDRHRLGALGTVALGDLRGYGLAIGYHPVNDTGGSVALNSAQVIG
jgi:hypothetical protein